MLNLDLPAAERFVDGHPNAFWDGWTLVLWKRNSIGINRPDGMLRDGEWGTAKRVDPNDKGMYRFRVN